MTVLQYDMIVMGAGVAGLWIAGRLKRAGYNVIVIDSAGIGAGQTLASQGMIHGGQRYALTGNEGGHAAAIAKMPARWEACLGGYGEVDLTSVEILSDTQVMWPAASGLATAAVFGAAKAVNAKTVKMKKEFYPDVFLRMKKFKGPVYELPEKVLDTKSLLRALAKPLEGRIFKGDMTELLPDGQIAISGRAFQAQLIVMTAGAGNERGFELLKIAKKMTQRRPLRQIMVRGVDDVLFGHGIVASFAPRLTVTTHRDANGRNIWYIGGDIATKATEMSEADAIAHAKKELADVFPQIDWQALEFSTWYGDRAEPYDDRGRLPPGPAVHQRGRVLFGWPVKMTFAPLLSDRIFDWLKDKDIHPLAKAAPPDLSPAEMALYPWEGASWQG